jgi:hypothetical protein
MSAHRSRIAVLDMPAGPSSMPVITTLDHPSLLAEDEATRLWHGLSETA